MSDNYWRCVCTTADSATCVGDDTFQAREPDGRCNCSCHAEYSEDPENWQPLHMLRKFTDEEIRDANDWLARIDAAEALTEEGTL